MLLDTQLILDNNVSLAIAVPGQPSAFTIDLMGVGVGQAPPNYFGVQDAVFGQDIGIGDGMSPPVLVVVVGTGFTTATGATLRVQFRSQGVWDYADVPEERWEALKAAESHGKYFHSDIKPYYQSVRNQKNNSSG